MEIPDFARKFGKFALKTLIGLFCQERFYQVLFERGLKSTGNICAFSEPKIRPFYASCCAGRQLASSFSFPDCRPRGKKLINFLEALDGGHPLSQFLSRPG